MTKLYEVTMTTMGFETKEQAEAFRDELLAAWEDIDAIAEYVAILTVGAIDGDLTRDADPPLAMGAGYRPKHQCAAPPAGQQLKQARPMSKPPSDSTPPQDGRPKAPATDDARARRLAEALRANLRRRKSAQKPGPTKDHKTSD